MPGSQLRGNAAERRGRILAALRASGFLAVTELAAELGVSDMTVRRDLRRLESDGQARVVHGGASLPRAARRAPGFGSRADSNAVGKRLVARAALGLLGDADTIAIDAGTTTHQLAAALPEGFAGCVVTHSVPVIQLGLARPDTRLVALGGDLYHASQAFVGPMTVDAAARLRLRTFFLGAGAVDARGVYVMTDIERPTKQALMDIADDVVLLVDAAKFRTSAPVLLCGLDRLSAVVTDQAPDDHVSKSLLAAGVRLIVAGQPAEPLSR